MLKDDYLSAIKKAGFKQVTVNNETVFPIDGMINDPIAQAIIKGLDVEVEKLAEMAKSVVSIKVSAVK